MDEGTSLNELDFLSLLLQALNDALCDYEASMLSRERYKTKCIAHGSNGTNEVTANVTVSVLCVLIFSGVTWQLGSSMAP